MYSSSYTRINVLFNRSLKYIVKSKAGRVNGISQPIWVKYVHVFFFLLI